VEIVPYADLVYRPCEESERKANGYPYFTTRLVLAHEVTPISGPYLFQPITRIVRLLANRLAAFQSGNLNIHPTIAIPLVIIPAIVA
jgi:hypothetical protein